MHFESGAARGRGRLRNILCGTSLGLFAVLALASCSSSAGKNQVATAASRASVTKEPAGDATPKRLRLLTTDQYINTITHLFGQDLKLEGRFAAVPRTDGLLEVGTARAGVTDAQLELYQKMAAVVANQVTNDKRRDVLVPCKPADEKAADKACATRFLGDVSRLLYRRKLDEARLNAIVDEADQAADKLKDFYAGLSVALEGILVSPNVLFVAETSEPDPKHPGHERLDAYSLASRLSLFLWNAEPDDALLKAAESGELLTQKGKAKAVDRMLASPRLVAGVRAFFDDMFGFDDFDNLAKDSMVYPSFTGLTSTDAREQTLRTVVDLLINKKGDYRDLFTTRETFLSPALAALYRMPSGPTWTEYEFPADSPRAGLLTQISFLALHSHPGRSSPTRRGKALRELLLCQKVPNPPANVDFSAVENPNSPIKTQRERVAIHLKNPVCAGCHRITDPIGLALENFDGAGQYRTTERGELIDASGSLDGTKFNDAVGLGKTLHDDATLPKCLVKRVFAYGTGGPETSDDDAALAYFNTRFAEQGFRLPDLLRTIAMSAAFSQVRETTAPVKTASAASGATTTK